MLRIDCPVCGLRDETEFSYGGDASKIRPKLNDENEQNWYNFVFVRENPAGMHSEYWQHVGGCRYWLVAERNTLTNEIIRIELASERRVEGE
jgi:sarcosine oxidase subunit delta